MFPTFDTRVKLYRSLVLFNLYVPFVDNVYEDLVLLSCKPILTQIAIIKYDNKTI